MQFDILEGVLCVCFVKLGLSSGSSAQGSGLGKEGLRRAVQEDRTLGSQWGSTALSKDGTVLIKH